MTRLILAVAAMVAFAGNAFASDKALSSLETASSSLIGDIVVAVPAGAEVPAAVAQPAKARQPHPVEMTWPNCNKASVSIDSWGTIYSNGKSIGRSAADFRTNCSGDVAWVATDGDMYLNETRLGRNASRSYKISVFSPIVAWSESGGDMYNNEKRLGRNASSFEIAPYNGIIVWKDTSGDLYKESSRLGRDANSFKLSFEGTVAWSDTDDDMYKDDQRLGSDARSFLISADTGDVAWLDTDDKLYKNSNSLARDVSTFSINPNGQVLWTDKNDVSHASE
ncbi:MAG: hypothetical protein Q7R35_06485 [Elusimicrobiota bacterium]|nr:hypothetical protein [Elusimicrobiota bacterium]